MIKYLKVILLITLFSFNFVNAQSVFCPTNVDFEQGNFSNWFLYTGLCCPISTPTLSGPVTGRHAITSGASTDAYGGFPVVAPNGGNYSLKLGSTLINRFANRARYYVRVPNNLNNYSLILRYAVVLENPGHTAIEQPRFEVKAYDSATNSALPCVQFSFVASSILPGFTLSPLGTQVWYKAWSLASLNLSGYAGRTVAVDVASGDCQLGGHFGYGYVDLTCGLFAISSTVCKGSTFSILKAPPGFQQYEWYDSTFSTLIGNDQTIAVATPAVYNKYYVVLYPYPGYGCPDTLSTTVSVSDLNLKLDKDTSICKSKPVHFFDTATASAKFQPLIYSWTPTTGLSCNNCLSPTATADSTTLYKLTVTDATGCVVSDSLKVTVIQYISTQPKSVLLCRGSNTTLRIKVGDIGPFTYKWRKNGVFITGANTDTFSINNVLAADTANYDVVVYGTCDSLISKIARIDIYPTPVITQQPQNLILCPGKKGILNLKATNPTTLTYQWFKNGNIISGATTDSLIFNPVLYADTGLYFGYTKAQCENIYSDTIRISVLKTTAISSQPTSVIQCMGTDVCFKVKATGAGSVTYQWYKNGTPISGANSDSVSVANIYYSDTGNYYVWVKSTCDSVMSAVVKLKISPPTAIVTQPINITKCPGTKAVFKVKANGTGVLHYQWQKNGNDIIGANTDSLVFAAIKTSDIGLYAVTVTGDCDSASIIVLSNPGRLSLFPMPVMNLPDTSKICSNNNVFTVNGFLSYLWNTGATTNSIIITQEGKYKVTFTDFNHCSNSDSTYAQFMLTPEVNAGNDTSLCNEADLKLLGYAKNYDTTQWVDNNYGNYSLPDSLATIFHPNQGILGLAYLKLLATNKCGTTDDSLKINFTPKPIPAFDVSDTVVCQGSAEITFSPLQNGGSFFNNSNQITTFNPLQPGMFNVKYIIALNGCIDSSSENIRVVQTPIADFAYSPKIPSIDTNVTFFTTGKYATRYVWDLGNGDTSSILNPSKYFPSDGYFDIILYVYREFCMDSITKRIRIRGSDQIWIPNAFTPNNDGENDTFKVVHMNLNGGTLFVYNRWGQKLFERNDFNVGWDGTFNGVACPSEVYFYVVDYIDNSDTMRHLYGNFTLLR